MSIEFSTEQYKKLLEIAFCGNWMANTADLKNGSKYEEILDFLLSKAKDFGLESIVEYDEEDKKYYESKKFEENVIGKIIDPYDEYSFIDILSSKMADEEFREFKKQDDFYKLNDVETFNLWNKIYDKYFEELRKNDIKNVHFTNVKKSNIKNEHLNNHCNCCHDED